MHLIHRSRGSQPEVRVKSLGVRQIFVNLKFTSHYENGKKAFYNALGGTQVFFSAWGYASRKRLRTADLIHVRQKEGKENNQSKENI